MSYTISPNMLLRIPTVGNDAGPDYAENINFDLLAIIDTHDHTPGRGVAITPASIDVNAALPLNDNFLTEVAGVTFLAQGSVPTINTLYESGTDLYFVDGLGNNVRITQSGGIAGSPGSITNLVSPASANYVSSSQTFVWQSNTNIAANMDAGSLLLRNLSPNSTYALTLEPPPTMIADSTVTLPVVPASTKIMTIEASGAIQSTLYVDDVTVKIVGNNLVAQGQNIPNSSREHNWELNGNYGALSYPQTNIDAVFFAPYDLTINSVWIYNGTPGTSGTTEFDLKVKSPGGAWASILTTTGKITGASTAIALTSVSTTATATLANHGFSTGQSVTISGATQTNYNGTFTITVTSANTFTYTMVGSAASPATGSPVMATPGSEIYTDSGSVVAAQVGVVKPVILTSNIIAGQAIRFDLLQSMSSAATDARIRIYWTQT